MSLMFLLAIAGVGLYMLRKSTPRQRILILAIMVVAFILLACGSDAPSGCNDTTWNTCTSSDLTGVVKRSLP